MGPQARPPGAREPLRPHLDLRAAGDLRSARRHRRLRRGAAEDALHRLSPPRQDAVRLLSRRRTRSRSRSSSSRPAAAPTARCWSTGCCAPTSSIRRSTCRRRSCSARSWAPASRPASWSASRRLKHVEAITFEANMEALMQRALARRRDGRLQHVLRDPLLRQARADRAAHRAARRAIYPRHARRRARARLDAAAGRDYRSARW